MTQNLYINRAFHSIEESYNIAKAKHTKGSNRYVFQFNDLWRNIYDQQLSIAIRSVHLWLRPRAIWLDGLLLSDGTNFYDISPVVNISGTMIQANKLFDEDKQIHHIINDKIGLGDYEIRYNPANNKLIFSMLSSSDLYFFFNSDSNGKPYINPSYDLKMITGITNDEFWTELGLLSRGNSEAIRIFNNGTYSDVFEYTLDNHNHIRTFAFKNVFNRENVIVHSSIVDLAYDNFLGMSNEQFNPPKSFPITYTTKEFWIELYDTMGNPIELPEDGADQLIIESMMNSQVNKLM